MPRNSTNLLCFLAATAASPVAASGPTKKLEIAGGGTVDWVRAIASEGDDWINDLIPLSSGNVVALGYVGRDDRKPASDWSAIAVDLSPTGKAVADRRYGTGSGTDAFWSMVEAKGGRRMYAGFSDRHGLGGLDAFALLAESDGRPVGEGVFGGEGYDRFTDVTQAGDGFVFVGHSQPGGSARRRAFLVKTDANGQEQWHRLFEGPESWGGLYVEPSGDGGFVVAGGLTEEGKPGEMFVVRTNAAGEEQWRTRIGVAGWDLANHGLVVRTDRSIVLVGYGHAVGEEANDLIAATIDPGGPIRSVERFGGKGDDRARLAKLGEDGRIWIAGHSDSAGAGGSDALVATLSAAGSFEDAVIMAGSSGEETGTAVLPLAGGKLLLAGYRKGPSTQNEDAFVVQLDRKTARVDPAFSRSALTPIR